MPVQKKSGNLLNAPRSILGALLTHISSLLMVKVFTIDWILTICQVLQ